jgi:diphthamide synthase (EF-2-diphthine--ammonia ligase)
LKAARSFDLCGELGEYHTLVVDGPIFKRRIKVHAYRRTLKEDRLKRQRWLLGITDFSLEEKDGGG